MTLGFLDSLFYVLRFATDEIFSLSDRVAVIFQGSLMDTFEADEAELSQIGLLMGGSVKNAR